MDQIISQFTTKSGKTVLFRYPTIDDAQAMMDYINKLSKEKTYILMQGGQKTLAEEKSWVEGFLNRQNRSIIILAFVKNNLVGISDISLKDEAKSHIGSFGISIDQSYRGEGIGKKLMQLVIDESIRNIKDLKIIELEVFGSNKIARNLYQKMGFTEFGCLPKSLKRKGKFDDAILMYKKV